MTTLFKEGALPLAAFRGSPQSIFAKMKSHAHFILAPNTPAGGSYGLMPDASGGSIFAKMKGRAVVLGVMAC
jgi:hypothetical protein